MANSENSLRLWVATVSTDLTGCGVLFVVFAGDLWPDSSYCTIESGASFGIQQQHCFLIQCTTRQFRGDDFLILRVSTVSTDVEWMWYELLFVAFAAGDLWPASSAPFGITLLFSERRRISSSLGFYSFYRFVVCSFCRGPLTCQQCPFPIRQQCCSLLQRRERQWMGNKQVVIATTNTGQKIPEIATNMGLERGVSSGVGIAVGWEEVAWLRVWRAAASPERPALPLPLQPQ